VYLKGALAVAHASPSLLGDRKEAHCKISLANSRQALYSSLLTSSPLKALSRTSRHLFTRISLRLKFCLKPSLEAPPQKAHPRGLLRGQRGRGVPSKTGIPPLMEGFTDIVIYREVHT